MSIPNYRSGNSNSDGFFPLTSLAPSLPRPAAVQFAFMNTSIHLGLFPINGRPGRFNRQRVTSAIRGSAFALHASDPSSAF
ncbi:hypothetical protein RRG08_029858 [Elysia crispata]|uniref:Uncharacterized protein n=1 Tax=Elysia crispata TaxID=231223 RepID=A0AAE1D0E6_9GAST|nr:hypothetical protein RRG08_029858 [Elysia crispata]